MTLVQRFFVEESGATAIEYGLIAAAMGIGLIVAFSTFGQNLAGLFNWVTSEAGSSMDGAGG